MRSVCSRIGEWGRVASVALLVVVVLSAVGCRGLGRFPGRADERMSFQSPLPALAERHLSLTQIARHLTTRAQQANSVRLQGELIVGAAGRRNPRQRFDLLLFAKPPDFARVRALQNGATFFDVLLRGQSLEVAVVPDRTLYRGSVAELRQYPQVLGGVDVRELLDSLFIESALLRKLWRGGEPLFYASRDHYEIRFAIPRGGEERYQLRKADLLVDRYQRFVSNRRLAEIRFWRYELVEGKYLIPTQIALEGTGGASVLLNAQQVSVNEPVTDALRAPIPSADLQVKSFAEAAREF